MFEEVQIISHRWRAADMADLLSEFDECLVLDMVKMNQVW